MVTIYVLQVGTVAMWELSSGFHDEYASVPFDITHFIIIKYEDSVVVKNEYEDKLRKTIESIIQDFKSFYKEEYRFAMDRLSQNPHDFTNFHIHI